METVFKSWPKGSRIDASGRTWSRIGDKRGGSVALVHFEEFDPSIPASLYSVRFVTVSGLVLSDGTSFAVRSGNLASYYKSGRRLVVEVSPGVRGELSDEREYFVGERPSEMGRKRLREFEGYLDLNGFVSLHPALARNGKRFWEKVGLHTELYDLDDVLKHGTAGKVVHDMRLSGVLDHGEDESIVWERDVNGVYATKGAGIQWVAYKDTPAERGIRYIQWG